MEPSLPQAQVAMSSVDTEPPYKLLRLSIATRLWRLLLYGSEVGMVLSGHYLDEKMPVGARVY